ncbi:MAG: glycosyltransferase [Candidatus Aminicenantes bacterium]|nr:glycosyltransferase [Candidatus Aminicenantes bacterium]
MIERFFNTLTDNHLLEPDLIERYLSACYFIANYFEGKHPFILDVGGRVVTTAGERILPMSKLFDHSMVLDIDQLQTSGKYIRGDGILLPFKKDQFDLVLSLDVLEHIESDHREKFLKELFRVSKDIVFLSFPFQSELNNEVDRSLYHYVKSYLGSEFKELKEHMDNKLPDIGDLIKKLNDKVGIKAKWLGYGGSLINFFHYFFFRYFFSDIRNKEKLNILENSFLNNFYTYNFKHAPFYRAFFIASKQNKSGFELRVNRIFKSFSTELESVVRPVNQPINELIDSYLYLLRNYKNREKIAVIIIYEAKYSDKQTARIFDHILTQRLREQPYEILVFVKGNKKISQYKTKYPQIKFILLEPNQPHLILQKILAVSNADYFYFMSENNITYVGSINNFFDLLKRSHKHFITFTYNSRLNEIDDYETSELLLLNCFIKRSCFQQVKSCQEDGFRAEFNQKIQGHMVNNYKKYFSLISDDYHILLATHLYFPARGGAENLAKNIAEYAAENKYNVKVITTKAYSTEAFFLKDRRRIGEDEEEKNGIKIERKRFSTRFRLGLNWLTRIAHRINYPYSDFIKIFRFGPRSSDYYKALLSEEYDLIISTPFPMFNTYYASRAAATLEKPLITIPCFHLIDKISFHNQILFDICSHSDVVIALTEFEKNFFTNELGLDQNKVFVIPPAIDHDKKVIRSDKHEIRKRYGIKEKNIILYLGQHGMHKNILNIVQSMKYVWKQLPDTALIIAGAITKYTQKLKKQAEKISEETGHEIYFFDNFDETQKHEIFQISDVFISLSEYESFGIVFIEAMQYGLPLIGSRNSVVKSIIDEFKNGLLVDPDNITEVAGSIIELLADTDISKKYGDHSMKKVRNVYDKKIIKEKILGVIEYVINKSKGKIS